MTERIKPSEIQTLEPSLRPTSEIVIALKNMEATRVHDQASKNWDNINRKLTQISPGHSELVENMIKKGMDRDRARAWRDALDYALGDIPNAKFQEVLLDIEHTNRKTIDTATSRFPKEIAGAKKAINLHIEKLREEGSEDLAEIYKLGKKKFAPNPEDTDTWIAWQIKTGGRQEREHADPFITLYQCIEHFYLPGKMEDEQKRQKGEKLRMDLFWTLSDHIRELKGNTQNIGHTEGLSYVLGEDNQIAKLIKDSKTSTI